jgi:2-polyprenyl-3-methyl-5-hydroxy-6-metoxy-1,4-benzoquinol methylase
MTTYDARIRQEPLGAALATGTSRESRIHERQPAEPVSRSREHGLTPGTALAAGCGGGAEAIWLASDGWHITAVDISSEALACAAERAATSRACERL